MTCNYCGYIGSLDTQIVGWGDGKTAYRVSTCPRCHHSVGGLQPATEEEVKAERDKSRDDKTRLKGWEAVLGIEDIKEG